MIIRTKKGNSSFADFSPKMLNLATLSFLVLLIGYSSFAILVVRSNANPPIDENNPEDAVGLLSYLKREQYGSWPIVYGQHFNAKLDSREPYIDGNPIYAKNEKKRKLLDLRDIAGLVLKEHTENQGVRASLPVWCKRNTGKSRKKSSL